MRFLYAGILSVFSVLAFYYSTRVFVDKNYTKKTNILFSVTALGSGLWCLGYGLMLVIVDEGLFLIVRGIGICGLFLFLIAAQVLTGLIADYEVKQYFPIGIEAIVGFFVFLLTVNPESVELIHSKNGIITVFRSPFVSNFYTFYTVFVALYFVAMTLEMLRPKYRKNIRVFAVAFLIIEGLIMVGMFIDTVLPALGTNLNIPASTMLQFLGLDILKYSVERVDRNQINIQNMADYMLNALKTPTIVVDRNEKIQIVNREAFQLWGLKKGESATDSFWNRLFDMTSPIMYRSAKDLEGVTTLELDGVDASKDMHCRFYVNPLWDEYKDYIGYIVSISDQTQQVMYTKELERTKDEAMRANRAKSFFLANMSHEIRTPMNSILGFSELAIEEENSEVTQGYLEDIHDSAQTLLVIINDILDISKIESGKMELVTDKYEPRVLFKDVFKIIEVQAMKKDLWFQMHFDSELPYLLKGDYNKLRQILINVLNNGIKYTQMGGVDLNVEFTKTEEHRGYYTLRIKDTGIGIKQEELSTVFDAFQRLDINKNSMTEGTGLGLSITRGFVELMGGDIRIESEYGKGTTFILTIWQELLVEKKPESIKEDESKALLKKLTLKNACFLAVDDTRLNLKLITTLLKKYGAEVEVVDNGQGAIELCKNKQYDIVFMDQMMPVMDGIETMLKLRESVQGYETNGPCKIIALTANVIDGVKEEMLAVGFDDFLGKPVNVKSLEETLLRHMPEDKCEFKDE